MLETISSMMSIILTEVFLCFPQYHHVNLVMVNDDDVNDDDDDALTAV